jgi:hypothetical protein
MNNLNETLPDLMRRATENLEPESSDLVERGMSRGVTLRRRRTALLSVSGVTAVLATAGIIITGTQVLGGNAHPPAAGTPAATVDKTKIAKSQPDKVVTPKETLDTLLGLLPPELKVSKPQSWGDVGFAGASALLDDGKGGSFLTMSVSSNDSTCFEPQPGTCILRPDGSRLTTAKDQPEYSRDNNPGGVLYNSVQVTRANGEAISLMSFNGPGEKQVEHSRAKPVLTVAELTKIADSTLWRFPPKPEMPTGADKPDAKDPGAGVVGVPVQQTLQDLKKVLPKDQATSRPESWGGSTDQYTGAAYLINDGKGLSRVDALVRREAPITKCTAERSTASCKVRSDGSVVGWTKNEPTYSDARQAKDGVVKNTVEIHYPDGRTISMSSYNGPQEKGAKHTRVKPAFTTDQLLVLAGNKAWTFPKAAK